jgi:hypothetical protein
MAKGLSRLQLMRAGVLRGSELQSKPRREESLWGLSALRGRLSLICGLGRVSAVAALVAQAQRQQQRCAWLVKTGFEPFAPDLQAAGIDINSLMVARLDAARTMGRAADLLARSGGLGLVVLDSDELPSRAVLRRLAAHAERYSMGVSVLVERPSLDAAFSLAVQVSPVVDKPGCLRLDALRDRGRNSLWQSSEAFHALPGCP